MMRNFTLYLKTVPYIFINYCIVFKNYTVRIVYVSEIRSDLSLLELKL
jgi:hypothetical protein